MEAPCPRCDGHGRADRGRRGPKPAENPRSSRFERGAPPHAKSGAPRDPAARQCPLLEGDLESWVGCCTRRFLPLARRVAGSDEHARDALHASWVLVLDKRQQHRGARPACGWVAAIVRHEAMRDAARPSRFVPLPARDLPAASLSPESALHAVERRRRLMAAIDELPPRFQEVVRLRDIEEFPNAEVARRLRISKRNVATRLHRAHRRLRRRLQVAERSEQPDREERGRHRDSDPGPRGAVRDRVFELDGRLVELTPRDATRPMRAFFTWCRSGPCREARSR